MIDRKCPSISHRSARLCGRPYKWPHLLMYFVAYLGIYLSCNHYSSVIVVANPHSIDSAFRPSSFQTFPHLLRNSTHGLQYKKVPASSSSSSISSERNENLEHYPFFSLSSSSSSSSSSSHPSQFSPTTSSPLLLSSPPSSASSSPSNPSKVKGYIAVASSALPETHYQKTLRLHSSAASNSARSFADPFVFTSSRRPILYSTVSSIPSSRYGYKLANDEPSKLLIQELIRHEYDQRVAEQQRAKLNSSASSQAVNLFSLLPPKKSDTDHAGGGVGGGSGSVSGVGGGSESSHNQYHSSPEHHSPSLTNGHSRPSTAVNILVFKPGGAKISSSNPPSSSASSSSSSTSSKTAHHLEKSSSSSSNKKESYGLPPRIPPKPHELDGPASSSSADHHYHHRQPNNYQKGHTNHDINSNPVSGGHFNTNREGENFGSNYITKLHAEDKSLPGASSGQRPTVVNGTHMIITNETNPVAIRPSINSNNPSDNIYINSNNNNNINGNNVNNGRRNSVDHNNVANEQDPLDYTYEPNDTNNTLDVFDMETSITGEAYRLTTERLAYILIGSCCALSILCLIIVAFSIRCRDMCDEYKAWKKAEKLAMINYRYHGHGPLGTGRFRGPNGHRIASNGADSNFFSHRGAGGAGGEQDSNLSYLPVKTTRPIFGPSCCCCPKPGTKNGTGAWVTPNSSETCPRGYFHPCPRGKLPFGAASSIQAFPRNTAAAAATANFGSDEDDSLNANVDDFIGPRVVVSSGEGGSNDDHHSHGVVAQCTCVEPPAANNGVTGGPGAMPISNGYPDGDMIQDSRYPPPPSTHQRKPNSHQHQHQRQQQQHLVNSNQANQSDKSNNPSWLQSSIIVDELHRKHSQMIREQNNQHNSGNNKNQRQRDPDDQTFIFWSENQDRLI